MKKFLLSSLGLLPVVLFAQGAIRIEGGTTRIVCTGSPYIVANNVGWINNGSSSALTAANSNFQFTGTATSDFSTTGPYSTTFYNFQINKTGGAYLNFTSNNMDIIVANTLTMTSGNVNMNGNTGSNLTLGTGVGVLGTLNRTSGHVYNGFFQRWYAAATTADNSTSEFPVGMNATSYNFARIIYTTAPGSGGTLRTRFVPTAPMYTGLTLTDNTNTAACGAPVTINNVANEGYWEVIPTNGMPNTGVYTARLCYSNFTTIGSPNCLRVVKSEDHLAWMQEGLHGSVDNVTTFSVTRDGQTGFSWFDIGGDMVVNPLPIELTSFAANCGSKSGDIEITWSTASEQNNAYFTLERSKDAVAWESVTTVPGAMNSNTPINYSYTDHVSATGYYYRLSQTDVNGDHEMFNPIYINCGSANSGVDLINAYVNVGGSTVVVFRVPDNQDYTLDIYDLRGRKLARTLGAATKGVNQVSLDVQGFSDAIYLVTLNTGGESLSKKFLVR